MTTTDTGAGAAGKPAFRIYSPSAKSSTSARSTPESYLAIVPSLLGFEPQDSIVVTGCDVDGRIDVTVRFDMPAGPEDFAEFTGHVVKILAGRGLTVLAAAYSAGGYGATSQSAAAAEALLAAVAGTDVKIHELLLVAGGRFWSYLCPDGTCCPAEGKPVPAAAAVPGASVLARREEIAARIAPAPSLPVRTATRAALERARDLDERTAGVAGAALVAGLIARFRDGGAELTDGEVGEASVALTVLRCRDDAWARMDGTHLDADVRLWTALTRRCDPGYAAAPGSLLAFCAWQQGDGALANCALDRALASDPQYSMALLLQQAIISGTARPLPMTPAQVAASYDAAN